MGSGRPFIDPFADLDWPLASPLSPFLTFVPIFYRLFPPFHLFCPRFQNDAPFGPSSRFAFNYSIPPFSRCPPLSKYDSLLILYPLCHFFSPFHPFCLSHLTPLPLTPSPGSVRRGSRHFPPPRRDFPPLFFLFFSLALIPYLSLTQMDLINLETLKAPHLVLQIGLLLALRCARPRRSQ